MLPPPGPCVICGGVHFIFGLMESLWGVDSLWGSRLLIVCGLHWADVCGFVRYPPPVLCATLMLVALTRAHLPSLSLPVPQLLVSFSWILLHCEHRFLSLLLYPSTTTSGWVRFRSPVCLVTLFLVADMTGAAGGCPLLRHSQAFEKASAASP